MKEVTETVLGVAVFPRLYRDSVTLMALASTLEKTEGVQRVGAVMATPANLEILARSEMRPDGLSAAPDDLVIAVRGVDEDLVAATLERAEASLTEVRVDDHGPVEEAPRTVAEGIAGATRGGGSAPTIATVSVPGTYAAVAVEQALRQGLHVFCFSDNVPIEDEVRLKRLAVAKRLLLMGPDCGTSIVDGTPLGFANVVRPGPVGIVAASGTGAQEISTLLDRAGVGIAQLIGVGGRDLSEQVGGLMTDLALDLLTEDEDTEIVVVVSKPPAPDVAARVLGRLRSMGRPAVACFLGAADSDGPVPVRGTLEGAALLAAGLAGRPLEPEVVALPRVVPSGRTVLGLFAGGTLAGEAGVILGRAGVPAEILDLGSDEFTVGRPHPMIDPTARGERVVAAGDRADVGVLLVDLVLGHAASADPATPLAAAVRSAREAAAAEGRELVVVGSVCGTTADPQGFEQQRRTLVDAGVVVLPSNAAAARAAAEMAATTSVPEEES